jgi:DNA-binding GntR family transcriptional regulator
VRCRDDGQENLERAVAVIRSALLDRIARGGIGRDGRVPPFAMASAAVEAGIGAGAVRYALGELAAAGALRLVPGRGYYLRSRTALAGHVKAGAR